MQEPFSTILERCFLVSATHNSLRSQVPQKSKSPLGNIHAITGCPHPGDPMPAFLSGPGPAPDAHASLLKLPPPQIIFCAATPEPGLRPLVWVNAP